MGPSDPVQKQHAHRQVTANKTAVREGEIRACVGAGVGGSGEKRATWDLQGCINTANRPLVHYQRMGGRGGYCNADVIRAE